MLGATWRAGRRQPGGRASHSTNIAAYICLLLLYSDTRTRDPRDWHDKFQKTSNVTASAPSVHFLFRGGVFELVWDEWRSVRSPSVWAFWSCLFIDQPISTTQVDSLGSWKLKWNIFFWMSSFFKCLAPFTPVTEEHVRAPPAAQQLHAASFCTVGLTESRTAPLHHLWILLQTPVKNVPQLICPPFTAACSLLSLLGTPVRYNVGISGIISAIFDECPFLSCRNFV